MINKDLLALKEKIKRKIPEFVRESYGTLPRIRNAWRKPKGLHSKLRHGFAGHRNKVEPGYGTPADLRGREKRGLKPVLVHNLKEMEKINPAEECAILAKIGLRNKIALIKKVQERKITVLNLKNPAQFLERTEQEWQNRKKSKNAKAKTKDEKAKKIVKEAETPAKKEEKIEQTEESKKEQEKKELDKLLTKKEP